MNLSQGRKAWHRHLKYSCFKRKYFTVQEASATWTYNRIKRDQIAMAVVGDTTAL